MLPRDVTADRLQTEEQQLQALQASGSGEWKVLLPRTRLGPGALHYFNSAESQINNVCNCCFIWLLLLECLLLYNIVLCIYCISTLPVYVCMHVYLYVIC